MTGVRFHLVLLAVAAVWAYQTWSRDVLSVEDRERVLVWEVDTLDVTAVRYASADKTLEIQRRTDEDGDTYLWAIERPVPETGASEYPVGTPGNSLLAQLSALRAIRELGPAESSEGAFGLEDATTRITVEAGEQRRELAVGDSTYGGDGRYVRDESSGTVYVIPVDLVRPFQIGAGAVRVRRVHRFPMTDAGIIRVSAGDVERTMVASEDGWRREGSDAVDAVFNNFHTRVDQLAIAGFEEAPAPDGLELLLRLEYLEADGDPLGFLELYRDSADETASYYLLSENTRVLASAVTSLAERVDQDLAEVLR